MAKVITTTEADQITIKDADFCIKSQSNFTHSVYHNICTGEQYTVQTGVYDYMLGIPFAIIVALIPLILIRMVFFD